MTGSDAARDRVARNEVLFRQVNERVRDVSQAFATLDPSPIDFVCECGNEECATPISLTLGEYEAVRANPARFVVVPNHVVTDVDRVVADRGAHLIVEKLPDEQHIARKTDPRS